MAYTLGIDYGTNSVRAIVVNCLNGDEIGTCVFDYPSGHQGILLDPRDHHLARQNPADYLAGLEQSVQGALAAAAGMDSRFSADKIIGIGVDTTGSSPIPVDKSNQPLAFTPEFADNLAAQCWLWKDHTSASEAARITELAAEHRPEYIAKCGNTYSSEWFWSKVWHCLNTSQDVFQAACSWVEISDWIPSVLAGISDPLKVKRGICAAGHKALYCDEWGGLPDKEFLALLDPALANLRDRLYDKAWDANEPAGTLCANWAGKLGLQEGIPVAIGEFDVHYGAIGCGVDEGILVKVIGTSTCDCCVIKANREVADIPGICGIVKGAILPGYYGVEAGQSAVGDIFKWWVEVVCQGDDELHRELTEQAATPNPGASGLLALDWNNGNRTILVDVELTGLLLGQTLHTSRAEIYRALIEATAFGARAIIERLKEYGLNINRVICSGGIAEKNPFLMQTYADILKCTMQLSRSSQSCALGAAIAGAVVAGAEAGGYGNYGEAQSKMTGQKELCYQPDAANSAVYDELYALYKDLHDNFGGVKSTNLGGIMKALLAIKKRQTR